MIRPGLPDDWQCLTGEDEPLPPLAWAAAAASLGALVGMAFLIASPLMLYRKLTR